MQPLSLLRSNARTTPQKPFAEKHPGCAAQLESERKENDPVRMAVRRSRLRRPALALLFILFTGGFASSPDQPGRSPLSSPPSVVPSLQVEDLLRWKWTQSDQPEESVCKSEMGEPVDWGSHEEGDGDPALADDINDLLRHSLYRNARWGIEVYSLDDEKLLYSLNSHQQFQPASNTKLFTTAAALHKLGPDYRFKTRLNYEGVVSPDGVLSGHLILRGQGDPNLAFEDDPFLHLDRMVQKVKATGIRTIEGDIIGDDGYFSYLPQGEGWLVSDLSHFYGARISALSFDDNLITLRAARGVAGQPARFWVEGPGSFFNIENNTLTVSDKGSPLSLRLYADTLEVSGEFLSSLSSWSTRLPVGDPAQFTADLFRSRLELAGIRVKGIARARHAGEPRWQQGPRELYVHYSRPLLEIVASTNKRSQNLYAEILLRTLGAEIRGVGSDWAGIEVVSDFLSEMKIDPALIDLHDGSGLSRMNLVSPRAETMLLAGMSRHRYYEDFLQSLPTSGLDGTLRYRLNRRATRLRVHAKTGTLNDAVALGGYLETHSGKTLAFTIFVNQMGFSIERARSAVDRICSILGSSS